jgi:hypothetical protein
MTLSTTTGKMSLYTGDGADTTFDYTFRIDAESDLQVLLLADTDIATLQTVTTHYTVSGVGEDSGGTVTFVTAPTSSQRVLLMRVPTVTQTTDYTPAGAFPATSHESALDKLTQICQHILDRFGWATFDEDKFINTSGDLILQSYTDSTRPDAGIAGRVIFNTDDGAINVDDGTNWTDAAGTTT